MNQALITIILVLGLGSYYLYTQNETLKENNQKLEYAVAEQQAAMEALRESYEKQGKSLLNMSRRNAEIEAEIPNYQAVLDGKHYQKERAVEYPSIQDQLDDLYHNGIDGWKATIKAVKDKYPKEE